MRKKFLQLILISLDFCFLETTPVLAPNVLVNENPKVDTSLNSRLHDWEYDDLPHSHRHRTVILTCVGGEWRKAAAKKVSLIRYQTLWVKDEKNTYTSKESDVET